MVADERRQAPRVRRYHLLFFTDYDDQGGIQNQSLARTLDLSRKGLLFETVSPPDPGDWISLEVQVGEKIFCLQGHVIHTEQLPNGHFGVGVSLPDIPADVLARIEHEVREGSAPLPTTEGGKAHVR